MSGAEVTADGVARTVRVVVNGDALDREVVPRSSWGRVVVTDGSLVEVVAAAAGG